MSKWRGKKHSMEMCTLPTSPEDETTTVGLGSVLLNTLMYSGMINVTSGDADSKKIQVGDKNKWLYLVGDGLTQTRIKAFNKLVTNSMLAVSFFELIFAAVCMIFFVPVTRSGAIRCFVPAISTSVLPHLEGSLPCMVLVRIYVPVPSFPLFFPLPISKT